MIFDIVSELFSTSATSSTDMTDFTAQPSVMADHPFLTFLVVAVFCFLFGAIMALIYSKTQRDEPVSTNFALTLAMLPAVIGLLVLLVSDNIARAFSLAGIFALVRFRSVPGDPKDLATVVFTMAVGLAAGLKLLAYAAAITVLFVVFMLVGYAVKSMKSNNRARCRLKITVPEDMCWDKTFDEVLEKYTRRYVLQRVKTVELGSFFELAYDVTLRPEVDDKALIDEIRQRNGNLTVLLNKKPDYMYEA